MYYVPTQRNTYYNSFYIEDLFFNTNKYTLKS